MANVLIVESMIKVAVASAVWDKGPERHEATTLL